MKPPMSSISVAAVFALLVLTVAGRADSPPNWREVLKSEITHMEGRQIAVYSVEHGYMQIPVTSAMAEIFSRVPEAEITPYLREIREAKENTRTEADRDFLDQCVRAIQVRPLSIGYSFRQTFSGRNLLMVMLEISPSGPTAETQSQSTENKNPLKPDKKAPDPTPRR